MGKKKLDMFKYTDKGWSHWGKRDYLSGVFHEGGRVIATDARVLAIVRREYPASLEGKLIDKKGNEIEAQFPNYKRVIPDIARMERADSDTQWDVIHALRTYNDCKNVWRIFKKFDKDCYVRVEIVDGVLVSEEAVKAIAEFLRVYPDAQLYLDKDRECRASEFVYVGNGTLEEPEAQMVFMPCRYEMSEVDAKWHEVKIINYWRNRKLQMLSPLDVLRKMNREDLVDTDNAHLFASTDPHLWCYINRDRYSEEGRLFIWAVEVFRNFNNVLLREKRGELSAA